MLNTVLKYMEEERTCPHCKNTLSLCHAPPVHVGDGLGWGSEYLFICLNNDCPLFTGGWDYIENQYGHVGSYRHMEIPNSNEKYNMMVAGRDAFSGSVVDIEELKKQNVRYGQEQEAIAAMVNCVEQKNIEPVVYLLTEEHAKIDDRLQAASLLVPLNDIACIEPLRNHTFKNQELNQKVNLAIAGILSNHFLKECPYCAELIKVRAKVCKHCQKELD